MTPVNMLERRLLPLCEFARESLASKYPQYTFNTWSSSVGGATSLQGHNLGLEAIFPDAPTEYADTVAIVVGIRHLTTTPMIDDMRVGWGVGEAPTDGIEILDEPISLNEGSLQYIETKFPTLLDEFESAINAYADLISN